MYIVNLINDNITTTIHGKTEKLISASVVKGINAIDSFSFALLPSNKGYNRINDRKTLVSVYNTNKKRYEFWGRVLYSKDTMDTSGRISKDVTCESFFGFLYDSIQDYVTEKNWTVNELLAHILNTHNAKVEDYKQFSIGEVTVTDPNDNLFIGVQRETSWKTLNDKLIAKLGGEIRFRVVEGVTYFDYLTEIGETKATAIELSRNMKQISKEKNATAYITRLEPYGCKLTKEETITDDSGNTTTQTIQTEERLDISSVNGGLKYIEDADAVAKFGIIGGTVNFDDVTEPENLLRKGTEYLAANNKMLVKYSVTALDLSLLGLDIDDFEVCNWHPLKNKLLGIDDTARIIKKTINVIDEISSSFEIGDNFKTLSDLQFEQSEKIETATQKIGTIESDYVTNEALRNESLLINSLIAQAVDSIILSVEETYQSKAGMEELRESVSAELQVLSDELLSKFTTTTEQIENIDGDLQTKFEELYKYIKMSDDGITIQSSDSVITLQVDNEEGIIFSKNGVAFGTWDGENFHTGNIVIRVEERAQFGNFAFIPRSDGSLSFLKVGE